MLARAPITGLIFALLLTLAGFAAAQSSGGEFGITRQAIAGGGARAAGGDYAAVVTIAQSAPGIQGGGDFVVRGGFHLPGAVAAPMDPIFSDGFEN